MTSKNTHEILIWVPDHLDAWTVENMVTQVVAAGNEPNSGIQLPGQLPRLLGLVSGYGWRTPGIHEAQKLFATSDLELVDDGEDSGSEDWTWSVRHEVDNPEYDENDETEYGDATNDTTVTEYLVRGVTLAKAVACLTEFSRARDEMALTLKV